MRILDDAMIDALIKSNPGDFALYLLDGGKLMKLYAAESLPELSGMTPEEYDAVTAEDASAIILDCDRARAADEIGRMLSEGTDGNVTYRIMHRTLGFVWVHARARVIGEKGGVPVVMVSFTATSLEAQEQNRLLDYTETIIYVTDKATYELLYGNGESLKLWNSVEYAGRACYDFINGRSTPCPWCSIPKLKDGECSVPAAYSPMQDKYFDIHCRELDWHGRDAVAVFAHDVTAQQQRQRSLELDVINLDRILGSIPGGVAVFSDRNGEIRLDYTNDGFYSVHFGSREFWKAKSDNPVNWLCQADRAVFEDEFKKVKSGLKSQGSATYRVTSEDGKLHWVNNQFRPAYFQDGVQYYYSSFASLDDQKEAEAARAEARRMYESAVQDAKLVVWEYDILNHRVVMAENEFTQYDYRKFRLPKITENAPQALISYIDDRYVETFLDMYRKIDSGAPTASCEVWYKLRPGTEPRCERIMYTTVFDDEGKPVKAYGIGQNITAQKQDEENYSRLYRQISESLAGAVASFKLNLSKNLYVSGYSMYPSLLEQLQKPTADEHFAATAAGVANERLQREILAEFTCDNLIRLFHSGRNQLVKNYPVRTGAGGIMWINAAVSLLQNPQTGDVEAVSYAKDISRQKKDEEIISRFSSEGCDFLGIIEPASGTVELHDGGWDSGVAQGKKTDYRAIRDRLLEEHIPAEERTGFAELTEIPALCLSLEQNPRYTMTYNFIGSAGPWQTLKKQLRFSWLNEERSEILVIQSDITEAYRREQLQISRLREAVMEAERANSAKSEFVSRISHDIRTPISIINSMTRFAREDIDDREKLLDDLRKIESSDAFLLSLINDVLDISKIDSGKTELHKELYLLGDYVSNIRNMFEPMCKDRDISLHIETGTADAAILVDRTRLNQLTLNLMSNAVKYTPPGGSVSFSAESRKRPDGRLDCEIRVADTGIGMSPEFQRTMFEPFTQEYENPGREKTGTGTGLGLAIVKKIVDLMGGAISVESELGRGTDFCISLICDAADPDSAAGAPQEPRPEGRTLSGTVLLAEDNPINAEIARRILRSMGLETVHAENGREAVDAFAAAPPGTFAAVLMDIQMPIMDGYEATLGIRALLRPDAGEIPVIAMTADAFSAALEHSRAVGMTGYTTKPIDPDRLRAELEKVIK